MWKTANNYESELSFVYSLVEVQQAFPKFERNCGYHGCSVVPDDARNEWGHLREAAPCFRRTWAMSLGEL